jgi:hypothetical protein
MISRCKLDSKTHSERYADRGITVCERWKSFKNFLQDMGERPSKEYTIERKDNDLGYFPENCKWATASEQGNNKRNNVIITMNDVSMTLAQWSLKTGIGRDLIQLRIDKLGWSIEKALNTPARNRNLTHDGKTQSVAAWSRELNIDIEVLRARLKYKWPTERVLTTPVLERKQNLETGRFE